MNAERMEWQPGRRLLGPEVSELAAYLTSKAARAQLEGPLTGALSLRAARKLEEAATIAADTAIFSLIMRANGCTGGNMPIDDKPYTADELREMLRGAPGTTRTGMAALAAEMGTISYRLNRPSSTGLKGKEREKACQVFLALGKLILDINACRGISEKKWNLTVNRMCREVGLPELWEEPK